MSRARRETTDNATIRSQDDEVHCMWTIGSKANRRGMGRYRERDISNNTNLLVVEISIEAS
eukprot:scaffold2334_cov138-Skeletonema_menzelii.AAC.4